MQHRTERRDGHCRNVCVATDDGHALAGISRSLVVAGCDVMTVASARELLTFLVLITDGKAARPDLFITAPCLLDLPDLDVVDELRYEGWAQPIIVLTPAETPRSATADPRVATLAAPFESASLIALMSALTC